jgi:phage pi2 protein 07
MKKCVFANILLLIFISVISIAQEEQPEVVDPINLSFPYNDQIDVQEYDIQIIKRDTKLFIDSNSTAEILFKAKNGYSKTEFKIKTQFYHDKTMNDIIVIYSYDELLEIKNKYFELSYLDTFTSEFFENNLLVIVIENYTAGTVLKHERIEILNNKIILVLENWHGHNDPLAAHQETILYLLKISRG